MKNQLVVESLQNQNNFSSSTHSIDIISSQNGITTAKEYFIPQRYYKEQLVLLPVNSKKFYIYWEFVDNTLEKFGLNSYSEILFKIIDRENHTLKEINCLGDIGEYFVNELDYTSKIKVIAGYLKAEAFIEIMSSNEIGNFNTQINYKDEDRLVYLKKERGFTEIIRSSLQHFTLNMNSASYVQEIERLNEFSKLSQNTLSSHILGGK